MIFCNVVAYCPLTRPHPQHTYITHTNLTHLAPPHCHYRIGGGGGRERKREREREREREKEGLATPLFLKVPPLVPAVKLSIASLWPGQLQQCS